MRHGERDRAQLIISLGEGEKGARLRVAMETVAQAHGKLVSVWARERLLIAVMEYQMETGKELLAEGSEVDGA